jgi:hypothetical protein
LIPSWLHVFASSDYDTQRQSRFLSHLQITKAFPSDIPKILWIYFSEINTVNHYYFATLITSLLLVLPLKAQTTLNIDSLGKMSASQLEELYRNGKVFEPTDGYLKGKAFPKPDKFGHKLRSETIGLVWKGKNIYTKEALMLNQVGKKQMVAASIANEESWLDGKPSVIFDYASGPKWAQKARDEVREIAPGLYLGIMYFRDCPCPKMGMFFALEKCPCKP